MTVLSRKHADLKLTVDLVILTVREATLQVLLIERGKEPYRDQLALPGGFLREHEDVEAAARRELAEETSLDSDGLHLQQLPVHGAPDRDPRGRVVTVPYLAIAPDLPVPVAGSDASGARWVPVHTLSTHDCLAFDHDAILCTAVECARRELEFTTVATVFCGATFTVGDLRGVYEVVWGQRLDPRNFSRKVTRTEGFIEPTGEKRVPEIGRPAMLYRRGPARTLYPPMLRGSVQNDT